MQFFKLPGVHFLKNFNTPYCFSKRTQGMSCWYCQSCSVIQAQTFPSFLLQILHQAFQKNQVCICHPGTPNFPQTRLFKSSNIAKCFLISKPPEFPLRVSTIFPKHRNTRSIFHNSWPQVVSKFYPPKKLRSTFHHILLSKQSGFAAFSNL